MNELLKSKFSRHIARILNFLDDDSLPSSRKKELVKGELWTLHNDLQAGAHAAKSFDEVGNR